MKSTILFGGPGASASSPVATGPWPPRGQGAVEFLLQDFCHYLGKIWLRNHDIPQDAAGLASFKITSVVEAYRNHRSAGRKIPIDEGLDLEQSYLLAQLITRQALTCFVNTAMPDMATARMARVVPLSPADLVEEVWRRCGVASSTDGSIAGQLQTSGNLVPPLTALVFDGFTGHCILLRGVERKTERLVYWDPWPLRSLLCIENNKAGVDAQLAPDGEFLWVLDPSAMAKVLYAVFVPARTSPTRKEINCDGRR